ncbi:general secretion pathway protein J [Glaciecola punicea ACAM 611]|uniref:Type II secretion system protein J n=1 Tax=Glaciecola punicea ACAM 611 TaxID=1121923 RepID=H5TAS3_9ALTE|nr:type II secretion system minor pseudopilin GspJ [Glaciecola punicea]GAB55400.1 general secretion pathway protein J [Glaciecola punicea ACAM 611]
MKTPQTAINNNLDCPDFYFTYKNHRGFTLLEIVIAIAIFSLLALGANSLLTTVMRSNEISAQREAKFEQLQRAMLIIERDFLQIQARTPRTQGLENDLIIRGGEFEFESDAYGIGFVRGGWRNPQLRLKRSTLQNVAYRLQENRLERLHTNYVDAVLGTEPNIRVLLDNVSDFKIEILSTVQTELEWSETIPSTELPIAIAVIMTIDSFGIIRREFQIKV